MKILYFDFKVSSFWNFRTVVSFGSECESLSDKKTDILAQENISGTYRLFNKEVTHVPVKSLHSH